MRIEGWNGYRIRFIEKDGKWGAVGKDVCNALGLKQPTRALRTLKGVTKCKVLTAGGYQELNIIDAKSIYKLAFKSRKKEAEDFQDWVVDVIDKLREASGLEGFQIFRMFDKEHQKEAMAILNRNLSNPVRVDFIKANTIANKAVSNKHGYSKMLKKDNMSPQMLIDREPILEDTVELMSVNEKFRLGLSVSKAIYQKYHS